MEVLIKIAFGIFWKFFEMADEKKHYCEKCDYGTDIKANFEKHLLTKGHLGMKKTKDSEGFFVCDICKTYKTPNGSNLKRHRETCEGESSSELFTFKDLLLNMIAKKYFNNANNKDFNEFATDLEEYKLVAEGLEKLKGKGMSKTRFFDLIAVLESINDQYAEHIKQ